jgi:glutamine synthetase
MTTAGGQGWAMLRFMDVFGSSHGVWLPADRLDDAVEHGCLIDGSALEGPVRVAEEDMLLLPDPSTRRVLGDGVVRLVCGVATLDGRPWPGDPRGALGALLERLGSLAERWEAVGELEFYLLGADGAPVDDGGYFGEGHREAERLVRSAAEELAELGVPALGVHHEAGSGQFEVDLGPLGPLAWADGIVLAKEVLRQSASSEGLVATFMARPFSDQPGSGLHVHQRLAGWELSTSGALEGEAGAAVAGMLGHAAGLLALGAPTPNSFRRLHSGSEAPSSVSWARRSRAALVRAGRAPDGVGALEYRGADPSANPYLLVAGLLAAIADGIDAGAELPPAADEDALGWVGGGPERATAELPAELSVALSALERDDVLQDALGSWLVSRFVDGWRAEVDHARSQVPAWERERYLERP